MKQTSSIGIMDFIRPHKGGFLCSVVLSVLGGGQWYCTILCSRKDD